MKLLFTDERGIQIFYTLKEEVLYHCWVMIKWKFHHKIVCSKQNYKDTGICYWLTFSSTRDLRARLEYSLDRLLDVCCTTDARTLDDPLVEGKDEIPTDTEFLVRSPEVTAIVRKELAVAIRDLMHHGLGQVTPLPTLSSSVWWY